MSFALAASVVSLVPRPVQTVSGLDEFASARGTVTLDPPQLHAIATFTTAESAAKLVIFVDGVRQSLLTKNGDADTYGQKAVLDGTQVTAEGNTVSVAKGLLQSWTGP